MTEHHHDDAATSARAPRATRAPKKTARTLTRLSAEEIARRTERQRPPIARNRPAESATLTPAGGAEPAETTPGLREDADQLTDTVSGPPVPDANDVRRAARTPAARPRPSAGPRQMTVWEDTDDAEVIAGWVLASTRADATSRLPGTNDAATDSDDDATDAMWRITTTATEGADPTARHASIRNLGTRDRDHHQVQRVRPAVIDLVLEHRFVSEDTDRRLTSLGIRFAVWSLTRTSDGEFDPCRDLTEDRIRGFVHGAGAHLSDGSRDTYAAALRRLAAGPTNRHTATRRKAVAPLPRRVEDGLWAAADAFHPASWKHQEAKTLLALTFGVGAMPAEANLAAPEDVIAQGAGSALRVSVRLIRSKTWVRDVPVLDHRYANWLAARAAQVAGQTYLFKPERRSRKDAINATTRRLAQVNSAFERFDLPAARNTWAVSTLAAGVPFAEWAQAAGIGPGTHLPTDLLAHLPTPDSSDVEAAFRRAAMRGPRGN